VSHRAKGLAIVMLWILIPFMVLAGPTSLEQAVDKVKAQAGGKVLKAETLQTQPPYHRIKVLSKSGKVYIFKVNSETGKVARVGK